MDRETILRICKGNSDNKDIINLIVSFLKDKGYSDNQVQHFLDYLTADPIEIMTGTINRVFEAILIRYKAEFNIIEITKENDNSIYYY